MDITQTMNIPIFFKIWEGYDTKSGIIDEAYAPDWIVRDSSVDDFQHPIDVRMKSTGREWMDFLRPYRRDFAEFNGSICLDSAFCVPRP